MEHQDLAEELWLAEGGSHPEMVTTQVSECSGEPGDYQSCRECVSLYTFNRNYMSGQKRDHMWWRTHVVPGQRQGPSL